ncbi:MAG: 2-oxoglutarate and iron-dependent oxygenase domain-containing protein [Pseudomonadota bacterium]|nr:2-oxoglutarate and iron-dependent oxygenase domain-containing protein [Pseudomonadota bacterium]
MNSGGTGEFSAKRLDFDQIPVIDIDGLFSDDAADRQRVADVVGEACRNVGFFYIRNHRVPEASITGARDAMAAYFDLPLDAKMKLDINQVQRHRGYVPEGGLYADPTARPDLQEGFELSLEVPDNDPLYCDGNIMIGPNVWPDEPAGFQPAVYGYFEQVVELGHVLFKAFALALGIEESFFEDKIDKPMGQLRLIYYPTRVGPVTADRIGIGAHSDYECFTILWQDQMGGLQVGNRDGDWVEAPPMDNTFIINIGDMMMRWSNDQFVSTPHRVINNSQGKRYSMPFFFGLNYDTVVTPLGECCGPDNPPHYPPTKSGWWTDQMITDAYDYRKAYRGKLPNPELAPNPEFTV